MAVDRDKVDKEALAEKIRYSVDQQLDMETPLNDDELLQRIEEEVFRLAKGVFLSAKGKKELIDRVYNSYRGLGPLQSLVDDKTITEIMINSHEEIFVERNGEVMPAGVTFPGKEKLEDTIQKIVGRVNRQVTEANPIVDARLMDGSRVNVVLPPIALKGPTMTIRKFPETPLTMEDLIARNTIVREAAAFLEKLVKARYNIFISGSTGSGKTTFLNVLSNFIPADERIITIEDSAELQIRSIPNLVSLETRDANTEGKGQITIRDLIKTSLRMRPNRIIVGEVRGAEALDMLQAMNTGHDGSLSTGHANSTRDMLSRLETMVLSGASIPVEVVRQQIGSAIDVMVHLSRMRDRTRKVTEICEVLGVVGGEIQLNPLFRFVETGEGADGQVLGGLQPTGQELKDRGKLQLAGIKL